MEVLACLPQGKVAEIASFVKVGMVNSLLKIYPIFWIHPQHFLHQIQPLLIYFTYIPPLYRLQIMDLWKLHTNELLVLQEMLVMLGNQRSQAFLYKVELIKVVFSREQGLSIDYFSHHATNRPSINGFIIVISTYQQLGRTVPPGSHIVRHYLVGRHGPCESQVADLNRPLFTDKHILGFHIPVDDVQTVHICYSPQQLIHVLPDFVGVDRSFFQNLQQIFLNELADQVNLALLAECLLETYNVLVVETFEDFDLSKYNSFVLFLGIAFLELFDGHQFPILFVPGFEDHSVLTLTYLFQNFVFVHGRQQQFQRKAYSLSNDAESGSMLVIERNHRDLRVLLVYVRILICCQPDSKSYTFST